MGVERLIRVLLFKPPKVLFNIYSIIAMSTSSLKEEYSKGVENIEKIGELDSEHRIHLYQDKVHYRKLFNYNDLYEKGEYRIIKKGKIGLATDGKRPMVYKKYGGIFDYEFKSELSCLIRLKIIENVPDILRIDFKNRIIYMDYIEGAKLSRVADENKKEIEKKCVKILNEIHLNKIIVSDLDARNIIHNEKECYFIDFGDSINCRSLPEFYFQLLRNIEIKHYRERVKSKYLKINV